MRVTICAVGRLRRSPEAALTADYLQRFDRTGRPLGLGPATVSEIDERKAQDRAAQGALLAAAIPEGAALWALDERGDALGSPAFACRIAGLRDGGARHLCLAIGGADGLAPALRERADFTLSLGPMVWPHRLVRVMLAEQLYRAASILAGTPYHRG
ncbi:MAG: 23S rRNA (pseudouridine(1915)-N(3))-methyltransferase RlmH [Alphaproteobacteria bacterium]|nr:MAG: 23S rRNA (pseudouridine(1915)-N(3))-methyltransferase RlmH [Alphaproteobacteria bacterium]